ncbi:MAG TPA: hypothetical protein VFF68_01935, partial [Anaerolineaceae bacterium]|nr:hypothetical protein [Anaerolineaceae bacterium]
MTSRTLPEFTSPKSGVTPAQAITLFLLFWAVAFGVLVRLLPVLSSPFPLNDGGLFYRMAADIAQAGFRLPEFTSYNHAGIPFAYPPLGLYL